MFLVVRLAVTALALSIALPALAADCGDRAGPGRTDVPCSCGDSLVTSTRLTSADPIVYMGGVDTVCADAGLTIASNRVRLDCDGAELRGDGSGVGIAVTGLAGARIQSCELLGFLHGVAATDCSELRITNSRVLESVVNGLLMVRCRDSSVRGIFVQGSNGNGIELIDSNGTSVKDNEVRESNGNGIDLQGSRGIVVSGNTVEDSLQDNLELGDSENNEIKGNTLTGATFAGVHVLSPTSRGNSFRKNSFEGSGSFDVHNGSGAQDNSFKGNTCTTSFGPDVDCP